MNRRNFVMKVATVGAAGGLTLAGCTTTSGSGKSPETDASKRQAIDASVDGTLNRLYSSVKGSRELAAKAQGILVFPDVKKAAFIVGGAYGEGALRVAGKTEGYYSTAAASFGFQAGAQSTAIIFMFMTRETLDAFRNAKGWSAGTDVAVSLIKVGANGTIDTNSASAQVVALVLTNTGLMADASVNGTKVTRMDL
jgi:lipid-binding SYLF domain-containing protein